MPVDRPLRLAVTGRHGQVTRALQACAGPTQIVLPLARPELDLASANDPAEHFAKLRPDVIVNAAAYTAVDKAESEQALAHAINARGAGLVARAAARLGIPVVQVSTDYVFNGQARRPYREDDPTAPINVYGATKLAGEQAVQDATPNHAILRTGWIYSPYGQNFMLTMLRLARERDELRVVDDQHGGPTSARDIAAAIVILARHLVDRPNENSLRGIFHFANAGTTTWAGFAGEIFRISAQRGGPSARVIPIPSEQYPTPARRPASSQLDLTKISQLEGIALRPWTEALQDTFDAQEGVSTTKHQ
jgi:dTDP-4-dehydrorhamnose reductase